MTTYDSHTVVANNETAAMLVYEINPVRGQLFSYANTLFCSNKFSWLLDTWLHVLYRPCCMKFDATVSQNYKLKPNVITSEKGLHANISSQSCSTHKLWGFWCNFTIVCECTVRFNHMKLVTSKLKLYYTSSSCLAASRASSRALALRFSISRACESCLDWKYKKRNNTCT